MDVEKPPTPLLDRAHLEAQTFGDADLAREVLSLFEDQCRRLLPALAEEGRPAGDRADLAHTLKGAALGVGAMRVAQASAAVEAGFRTVGEADLRTLRRAVEQTLEALGSVGLEA
ncbi:MAG TPA: Hpt domain-containing protein [Methylobacterium sp.]|uniref:Hpt domain-containing protein n=1 Tax=Methylorubrum sp. B1-46 TaxID=2897334 RepID=UPI001E538CFB|nr:Hpt domain-containing protein [Methylorubrum sp. B1-46]UGB25667.1 Hpt domain-containing protein [Methylorubrum sp. B1-46]HEV2541171.1 Hpt domain-containing protein [Methylobacterium sp.]